MPATSASSAASFESRSGAKPPSSPTAVASPRSWRIPLRAWKTSAPVRSPSANERRAHRHHHELLEVHLVVRVRAAVEHVHHRHRQHVRGLAAEVAPQRQAGLGGGRLGAGERHAEDRVGAQARPCSGFRRARSSPPSTRRLVGGVEARARARRSRRSRGPPRAPRPCRPRPCRRRAAPPPRTRRSTRPRARRRARPRRRRAPRPPRRSGCRGCPGSAARAPPGSRSTLLLRSACSLGTCRPPRAGSAPGPRRPPPPPARRRAGGRRDRRRALSQSWPALLARFRTFFA